MRSKHEFKASPLRHQQVRYGEARLLSEFRDSERQVLTILQLAPHRRGCHRLRTRRRRRLRIHRRRLPASQHGS